MPEFRLQDSRPISNRYHDELYELLENDMLETVLSNNKAAMINQYELFDPVYYDKETSYDHNSLPYEKVYLQF